MYRCLDCHKSYQSLEDIEAHWRSTRCRPCGHDDCQCYYMDEDEYAELVESLKVSE